MTGDEQHLTEYAAQVEGLLAEIESSPDPAVREKVAGIVQGMLALYGEGLARIVELVGRGEERSPAGMLEALAGDELVAHLLLLHDLHPVGLETRVARALEELRPFLQSRGAGAELIAVRDGTARLRLHGSRSCPSSASALRRAVEAAVLRSAPDLFGVAIEDADPPGSPRGRPEAFVPLSALGAKVPRDDAGPGSPTITGETPGVCHG